MRQVVQSNYHQNQWHESISEYGGTSIALRAVCYQRATSVQGHGAIAYRLLALWVHCRSRNLDASEIGWRFV